jgi:hypothetical protein
MQDDLSSPRKETRTCSDRPRRSTGEAAIMSNLRRTAAFSMQSNQVMY